MNKLIATILAILVVLGLTTSSIVAVYVALELRTQKQAICSVVATSQAGALKDAKFWSTAAARARTRALTDTGNAQQSDLDAAAADHLRAVQDLASKNFHFPGC